MSLTPSLTTDSSVSMCLAPGEYEIHGYEGGNCYEGWGGGFVRVLDIRGSELVDHLTVEEFTCGATATWTISEDTKLSGYQGNVRFERNRATGESPEFCGTGCGGAVYIVFLALYFLIVTYQLDTGTVYLSTNAMQVRWWAAPVAPA